MSDGLPQLARLIEEHSGLSMSGSQLPSLAGALRRVSGDSDPAAVLKSLTTRHDAQRLLERLIDEVAVKETFFLRERDQLSTVDWRKLLAGARLRGERSVRVWSAACATGEEPYTLAFLAGEALGWPDPPVDVLGTDISSTALALGARAHYRKRALRQVEPAMLERHFDRQVGGYSPRPHVRRLVRFAPHNLARASLPPEPGLFDLIICRNVLIYFSRKTVDHALELLGRAVAPGGLLLLGSADRLAAGPFVAPSTSPVPTPSRASNPRRPAKPLRPRRSPKPVAARENPDRVAPENLDARQTSLRPALNLANAGRLAESATAAQRVLTDEPMNAEALFVLGMVQLASGRSAEATRSLRAALYVRPRFALAAFTLARAYDTLGDTAAAKRSYQQALRIFDPDDEAQQRLLEQIDLADFAGACRARVRALTLRT